MRTPKLLVGLLEDEVTDGVSFSSDPIKGERKEDFPGERSRCYPPKGRKTRPLLPSSSLGGLL